MKRKLALFGFSAGLLLVCSGCENIREYSVNSYQGVMPLSDLRHFNSTMLVQSTVTTPEAVPAAGAASGVSVSPETKPASDSVSK